MRANIPRNSHSAEAELEGPYLGAMQEISVRLMDRLPAGDDLWRTLGQIETLLMEAQLQGQPLQELFGSGGVAAFCQSIVDEFITEGAEEMIPAAREKSKPRRREPRGGIGYRRKRSFTIGMAVLASLLAAVAIFWGTGLFAYWTQGSGYYLEELRNFQSSHQTVAGELLPIRIPLSPMVELTNTLYSDGEGFDITLTTVEVQERASNYTDPFTGTVTYQMIQRWYLRLTYAVDAGFGSITYVEPPAEGTVTVILADGTVYTGEISWIESGSAGKGREYARISLIDLPAALNTEGATLEVRFASPNRVEWERIRVGRF